MTGLDIGGLWERGRQFVNETIEGGRQAVAANVMADIHRDPTQLDGAIRQMGPQAQQFYERLGPTGQENLKAIIAQDARFLPALARAMEGGQTPQPGADGQTPQPAATNPLTGLPPGITNAVLAEMNTDAAFRTRMIETLERDPSKLTEEVGREAGQDTRFGMTLGREGIRAVMNGELNMSSLGGMNMGGMMQGMMGGLFGGLMQNFGGLFQGLQQIFGQIFQAIVGIFGGDRMVQSVGTAPDGQRPLDQLERAAHAAQIRNQGTTYVAQNGEVTPRTAEVAVSADTPMDPTRRVTPDPSLASGPR